MRNLFKQLRKRQENIPCQFASKSLTLLRVGLQPHSKLLQNSFGDPI